MAVQFPFSVDMAVRGYEIDSWGHVNNAVYLHWLEHARWEMGGQDGFASLFGKILPVVRHIELDYRSETVLGDHVKVSVWPRRVGTTSFVLGACIRIIGSREPTRVGTLALAASMAFACIERKVGKVPVPESWRAHFPQEDPGDTLPPGV